MSEASIDAYINWITPLPGDPTYSLLRAHLLFEKLIESALKMRLPHPSALEDARLTFAQKLAIVRAATRELPATHWTWQAVGRLNKIRNSLAHSPNEKVVSEIAAYVDFNVLHSNHPLPQPGERMQPANQITGEKGGYTPADLVTLGLYISLASGLGFSVTSFRLPKSNSA